MKFNIEVVVMGFRGQKKTIVQFKEKLCLAYTTHTHTYTPYTKPLLVMIMFTFFTKALLIKFEPLCCIKQAKGLSLLIIQNSDKNYIQASNFFLTHLYVR